MKALTIRKSNRTPILLVLFLLYGLSSCKNEPVRQTVKGYVVDATMNNVMIIADNGDTLNISTMDADPAKVHGVLLNDSVKITYVKEKVGESTIFKAEELVVTVHSPYFYIQGTWLEPNPINSSEAQGVTLNEDGSASSVGMASLLFKKWMLTDDKLLLTYESIGNKQTLEGTDTLQVVKLNRDSLVLSSTCGIIWRFARENGSKTP